MFCVSAFLIFPLFSSGLSLYASSALTPFSIPGIDLENIVYYKDDTHYFVMTAKKKSLLKKGVIKQVRTTHLKMCDSYWRQLKKKKQTAGMKTALQVLLKRQSVNHLSLQPGSLANAVNQSIRLVTQNQKP